MPRMLDGEIPKNFVRNKATEVRKKYFKDYRSPQDAFDAIFCEFNGSVEYVEGDDREETLRVYPNSFVIFLPLSSSKARDNFTVAHELGHFFLHTEDKGDEILRFTRRGSNRREWEANWFAAELLMPEREFKKAVLELGCDEIELASKFDVSVAAASVRLSSLGLC
ncbi:ImmA/IrrE family metallo-endopeptidase [Desulfomicrobium norvegicum]|nr:ImmA/IrrE family metallo-endopeptidase [Desulfomicrobium norvegicum]